MPAQPEPGRRPRRLRARATRDTLRDLTTIVVLVLALIGVARAGDAVQQQQEGRRAGQAITCGALNAVIDAGRGVIRSGITGIDREQLIAALRRHNLPVGRAQRAIAAATRDGFAGDQFARTVRRYGLRPGDVRRALADAAADAYAQRVTRRVDQENGSTSVVRKDGLLDCKRLRQITGVSH